MKNKIRNKLWQIKGPLDSMVENFTVGDDYLLDQKLLPYDIEASLAHAKMLKKIGVLTKTELSKLERGLNEILGLWHKGKFLITQEQEDGHTAIEIYLTNKFGDVGKKIHTGRSRNDQSLTMMRLYMKNELADIEKLVDNLISALNKKSKQFKKIPMPGYTHTRKAMPTTVSAWLDSFAQALIDLKPFLVNLRILLDQSPLGSAAGFGISGLNLDKKFTAKLLKFKKIQANPLYCGLSRGFFEEIFLNAFSPVMILIGRLANDLILFTADEFDFFSLPDNMTTGSSIMPQKRNYDLLELTRAKINVFLSCQYQIDNIVKNLISGYHRDLQLTKKIFLDGADLIRSNLKIMQIVVQNLTVKEKNLRLAMTDDLYATEKIYKLVNKGMPFRQAYMKIKEKYN
ncbi:MAG: argininosuccinate lyase [Candidatus Falkowbacteria bacterium]